MLGVTLADLIGAGLLKPPMKLISQYHGQKLEADLLPDGAVSFDGKRYNSSSAAGGAAIRKATGRQAASADGWKFWRYRDPSGSLVPLVNVRQEFLTRKAK
jgi:hypothetical protein